MTHAGLRSRSKLQLTSFSGCFAAVLLLVFVCSVAVPVSAVASGFEVLPILDAVVCSVPRAMVRTSTGEFYSACFEGSAGDLMRVRGSSVQSLVPSRACGPFSLTIDEGRNALHMGCLLNTSGVQTLWPNGTVTSMLLSDNPVANRSCTRTVYVSVSPFTRTLYVACLIGDKILAVVLRSDGSIASSNQIGTTSTCAIPSTMISVGQTPGSNTSDVLFAACQGTGLVLFNGTAPRRVVLNTTQCNTAQFVIQGPPGFLYVSCAYGLVGGGVRKVAIATLQATTVLEWNDSTCTQPTWLSYSAASDTLYVQCYEGPAFIRGSKPIVLLMTASDLPCAANTRKLTVSRIGDTDTLYVGCAGFGVQAVIPAAITTSPSACRAASRALALNNSKLYASCLSGLYLRNLVDISTPEKLLLAQSLSCRPSAVVGIPDGSRLYVGCQLGDGDGAVELRLNSSDDVTAVYNLMTYRMCDGVTDMQLSANLSVVYAACMVPPIVLAMPLSGPNAFTNRTLFSACAPSRIVLAPAGDVLYVSCEAPNGPAVLSVTTGAVPVVTTLVNYSFCDAARQLALSRDGTTLYCACAGGDLIVIDLILRAARVVGDVTSPCHEPTYLAISPVSGELFAHCSASNLLVSVINNDVLFLTVSGLTTGGAMTVSPVTGYLYTINDFALAQLAASCGNIAGWYVGLSRCSRCPAGSYRSVNDTLSAAVLGKSRCSICGPGTASALMGAAECSTCPAGQYSAGGTTLSPALLCFPCSPGSRSELPGSINCTRCEPGKTALAQMSTKCDACDPGRYATGYGNVQCVPCAQVNHGLSSYFCYICASLIACLLCFT